MMLQNPNALNRRARDVCFDDKTRLLTSTYILSKSVLAMRRTRLKLFKPGFSIICGQVENFLSKKYPRLYLLIYSIFM